MCNSVEAPGFKEDAPQVSFVSLDVNSLFPHCCLGRLPCAHYHLHDSNSRLVKAFNDKVEREGGLAAVEFYEKDSEERCITYLVEAQISYPDFKVQQELADMVPSVCKRRIELNDLSELQREMAKKMKVPPSCK